MRTIMSTMFTIFAILFILGIIFSKSILSWLDKFVGKIQEQRAIRRLAELSDIRKRIPEVETSIVKMVTDIRSMEIMAEDFGSEAWQARRTRSLNAVANDRSLLYVLEEREKKLKRELGIISRTLAQDS